MGERRIGYSDGYRSSSTLWAYTAGFMSTNPSTPRP